jgi:hypothetical protein
MLVDPESVEMNRLLRPLVAAADALGRPAQELARGIQTSSAPSISLTAALGPVTRMRGGTVATSEPLG